MLMAACLAHIKRADTQVAKLTTIKDGVATHRATLTS